MHAADFAPDWGNGPHAESPPATLQDKPTPFSPDPSAQTHFSPPQQELPQRGAGVSPSLEAMFPSEGGDNDGWGDSGACLLGYLRRFWRISCLTHALKITGWDRRMSPKFLLGTLRFSFCSRVPVDAERNWAVETRGF